MQRERYGEVRERDVKKRCEEETREEGGEV